MKKNLWSITTCESTLFHSNKYSVRSAAEMRRSHLGREERRTQKHLLLTIERSRLYKLTQKFNFFQLLQLTRSLMNHFRLTAGEEIKSTRKLFLRCKQRKTMLYDDGITISYVKCNVKKCTSNDFEDIFVVFFRFTSTD